MAIKKTYGKIEYQRGPDYRHPEGQWVITEARPHVSIKLKSIFPKIAKNAIPPYVFKDTNEMCSDLLWFMTRYPLDVAPNNFNALCDGKSDHEKTIVKMEELFLPDYKPRRITLNDGEAARDYQLKVADLHYLNKRFLLGDDLGLGKTLSGILTFMNPHTLPGLVLCQTHMTIHWKDQIVRFTNLTVHIIKGTKPYTLPVADIYIMKYSCLNGWVDIFATGFFKAGVFDEVQEFRRCDSMKYKSGEILSAHLEFCMGMSATPIYNYGDEIFNVLNLIKPGCLGDRWDFLREWASQRGDKHVIIDPDALGSYLRDNYLLMRRTRKEVGRELPEVNRIIQPVGYDDGKVKEAEALVRQLAIRVTSGSFIERGAAARELDILVRHQTGVSKAREVAAYVRILLENNEPVLLAGWHREVYDIWRTCLQDFNPVFYTGTESDVQKERSKQAFIAGETNLMIISLRSGIGLDGLQRRCKIIVVGELDWSPKVHDQLIGRIDRDGQTEQVTVIFTVSDYGSDPVIMDVLGLKSSQSHSILNPLTAPVQIVSDDSRIKMLAEKFLKKQV